MRPLLLLGSLSALLAVFLGAMGAHFLSSHMLENGADNFATANLYHMFHSLALLALGLSWAQMEGHPKALNCLKYAGFAMTGGLLCFSGMLYGASLTSLGAFHWLIPLGGLFFMAGWFFFSLAVFRFNKRT